LKCDTAERVIIRFSAIFHLYSKEFDYSACGMNRTVANSFKWVLASVVTPSWNKEKKD
jgi:hypothetical protein